MVHGSKNIAQMSVGTAVAAVCIMAGAAGCGGGKSTYINIEEKGKVAVVSYSMSKSVVKKGEKIDNGPGILQKDDTYYADHRKAVAALWEQFKQKIGPALLNVSLIDFKTVADNAKYQELTKHVPNMMLGKDIALGANELTPEGINYISAYNKQVLDNVAKAVGADLLLLVDNSASYDLIAGVSIAGFGGNGLAALYLSTTISLYEPGKGIVAGTTFSNESTEKAGMVASHVATDNFEKCLPTAQEKVFDQIKAYFTAQKEKAQQQAAAAATAPQK